MIGSCLAFCGPFIPLEFCYLLLSRWSRCFPTPSPLCALSSFPSSPSELCEPPSLSVTPLRASTIHGLAPSPTASHRTTPVRYVVPGQELTYSHSGHSLAFRAVILFSLLDWSAAFAATPSLIRHAPSAAELLPCGCQWSSTVATIDHGAHLPPRSLIAASPTAAVRARTRVLRQGG